MNKGYIKVVLFLLSLFSYVPNKALASEKFPREEPAGVFSSRNVTARKVTTYNTYSNTSAPSNNLLNTTIIRSPYSNPVGQKSTRPIGAIQSNDNPYGTVSRGGNSKFTGRSNDNSNTSVPSNNRPNAAIIRNANSNTSVPYMIPKCKNRSNANSNTSVPYMIPKCKNRSNDNSNTSVPNMIPKCKNRSNDNSNTSVPYMIPKCKNRSNDNSNTSVPNMIPKCKNRSNDISNIVCSRITTSNYYRSNELYEEHNHLLCTNHGETIRAEKVMKEAVSLLIQHATDTVNDDKSHQSKNDGKLNIAKHDGGTYIGKSNYKYPDPDMYIDLVDMLWDPSCSQKPDKTLKNGKVVRVYTPNLIMVQYRYKNDNESFQRYFYALAAKHKISENTTVIAMTSGNINDHNRADTKIYNNPILESANLFKTEVKSEPDIRKGELKKMFVNLSGYLIKKESKYVDITYVRSVDGNVPNDSSLPTKTFRA